MKRIILFIFLVIAVSKLLGQPSVIKTEIIDSHTVMWEENEDAKNIDRKTITVYIKEDQRKLASVQGNDPDSSEGYIYRHLPFQQDSLSCLLIKQFTIEEAQILLQSKKTSDDYSFYSRYEGRGN